MRSGVDAANATPVVSIRRTTSGATVTDLQADAGVGSWNVSTEQRQPRVVHEHRSRKQHDTAGATGGGFVMLRCTRVHWMDYSFITTWLAFVFARGMCAHFNCLAKTVSKNAIKHKEQLSLVWFKSPNETPQHNWALWPIESFVCVCVWAHWSIQLKLLQLPESNAKCGHLAIYGDAQKTSAPKAHQWI